MRKLFGFATLLIASGLVLAQGAEQTDESQRYERPIPAPLYYPEILSEPDYTFLEPVAPKATFGEFEVELGKTKLSDVVKTLGGDLQHLKSRTDFLCYSAPVQLPLPATKKRKKQNPPPEEVFQNIWLIVGERGQISQVMMERIPDGAKMCPALPEQYNTVSMGEIRIGLKLDSLSIPAPSKKDDVNLWKAWFSQTASGKHTDVGILSLRTDANNQIDNIISINLTVKNR